MSRSRFIRSLSIATLALGATFRAQAGGFPINPSDFTNIPQLLTPAIANPFVKTLGLITDDRPYEPATPLGMALGLEFGVQATVMKLPDDFKTALATAGITDLGSFQFLPMAKLDVHKGIGDILDIGANAILYEGYRVLGGDAKLVVYNPEEGVTVALRLCYSYANLNFVTTRTYTPQLLISRKLEFADPYMGVGYSWIRGHIDIDAHLIDAQIPAGLLTQSADGSGQAMNAFLGIQFRVPHVGLFLVVEGSYSNAGADTLGTKFGFSF